jgi:DNA-binding response OmpR family regulator
LTRTSGAATSSTLLVLYVEDEAIVSLVVTMSLEDAGFEVRHLLDGKSAIRALETNASQYHALITDVRLPDVDGWGIARRARELSPTIPVIYVSGDSAAEWSRRGVPRSIMIEKPFANASLLAAIKELAP